MFEIILKRKKRWYFFEERDKIIYMELPRVNLCHSIYTQGRGNIGGTKDNFVFSQEAYFDIKWSYRRLPDIQ